MLYIKWFILYKYFDNKVLGDDAQKKSLYLIKLIKL